METQIVGHGVIVALTVLLLMLRGLAIAVGLLAIYVVVGGVYENEEGMLQDSIELIWLKLAYTKDGVVGRHTGFIRTTLAWLGRLLDRIFGKPLVSWHFFGVSFCLSMSTAVFLSALQSISDPTISRATVLLAFAMGAGLLAMAFLPAFFPGAAPVTATAALMLVILQFVTTYGEPLYLLIFSWSLLIDALVILGSRFLYRSLSKTPSIAVVLLGVLLGSAIIPLILLGPIFYFGGFHPQRWPQVFTPDSWAAGYAGLAVSMNYWTLIPTLLILTLLITYGLHRVFWPLALRPLYLAQRIKLLQYRKTLMLLGIYLVLAGVKPRLGTLKWIAALFGVHVD